jgi:hypothetical protein
VTDPVRVRQGKLLWLLVCFEGAMSSLRGSKAEIAGHSPPGAAVPRNLFGQHITSRFAPNRIYESRRSDRRASTTFESCQTVLIGTISKVDSAVTRRM